MIAVTADEVLNVGLRPLREVQMVVVQAILSGLPDVEGLVHDEETHLVGEIQELGHGRVVSVRMALTPMPFNISNWRSRARWWYADPIAPRSWCMHIPQSFIDLPLREKPVDESKLYDRKPMGTRYVSTVEAAHLQGQLHLIEVRVRPSTRGADWKR